LNADRQIEISEEDGESFEIKKCNAVNVFVNGRLDHIAFM